MHWNQQPAASLTPPKIEKTDSARTVFYSRFSGFLFTLAPNLFIRKKQKRLASH